MSDSCPTNLNHRTAILKDYLGYVGNGVFIEPPFICGYGKLVFLEQGVFINFGCTILDSAKIEIGMNTKIGPQVQIYTASHPLDPSKRIPGELVDFARPIKIGANCWIGGGSIILAGIEIGENTTIGAGSVVTKSIPANSLAVGNPARVVKKN